MLVAYPVSDVDEGKRNAGWGIKGGQEFASDVQGFVSEERVVGEGVECEQPAHKTNICFKDGHFWPLRRKCWIHLVEILELIKTSEEKMRKRKK